jgi:hypothetical protein
MDPLLPSLCVRSDLDPLRRPVDLLLPSITCKKKKRKVDKTQISRGFVGRPALGLVDGVTEYIEFVLFSTSAAQNRRRTSQRSTIDVSLSDLNDQLKDVFPEVCNRLIRFRFGFGFRFVFVFVLVLELFLELVWMWLW